MPSHIMDSVTDVSYSTCRKVENNENSQDWDTRGAAHRDTVGSHENREATETKLKARMGIAEEEVNQIEESHENPIER
jgi:hypothetical protein